VFVGSFSLTGLLVAVDGAAIGVGLDLTGSPIGAGVFRLAP
jgi:hypothetical protein